MFSNFTEETATGTGNTLALAGATSDHIAFQESFADGDLVAYALEDSGGTIKVAGIGTYVSATDDITRNDTWNWNGTVVDKNPSTNITLSGGTHTVRCAVTDNNTQNNAGFDLNPLTSSHDAIPDNWVQISDSSSVGLANRAVFVPAYYASPFELNALQINVLTASATDVVQAGICKCGLDGLPGEIIEIVTVDVTAVAHVVTSLSQTYKLPAGRYFTFSSSKDVTYGAWRVDRFTHAMRSASYVFRGGTSGPVLSSNVVSGIITTPLAGPFTGGDPVDNVMVLPRMT